MSYGTIGADVIQTSGANLSPVFKDLNDSVVGTLPKSAQIAKAWVNFDGTLSGTITPRASFNVTSVTKNGTGDYTINFTNAMSNANYCCLDGQPSLIGSPGAVANQIGFRNHTTSKVDVTIENSGNGTFSDKALLNVLIVGN